MMVRGESNPAARSQPSDGNLLTPPHSIDGSASPVSETFVPGAFTRSLPSQITPPVDNSSVNITNNNENWPAVTITNQDPVSTSQTTGPAQNNVHPRRTRPGTATVPQLQRDTVRTAGFVQQIVTFAEHLIDRLWSNNPVLTHTHDHNGNAILPLNRFIQETLRRSKTSYTTLQIALIYLLLLRGNIPPNSSFRASRCGRRMFLTSLILASKYIQDRNYSARAWTKISGLDLQQIKENEKNFLSTVQWNLHIPKEWYDNWVKITQWMFILSNPNKLPWASSPTGAADIVRFGRVDTPDYQVALRNWWDQSFIGLRMDVLKEETATRAFLMGVRPFRGVIVPVSCMPGYSPRVESDSDRSESTLASTDASDSKTPASETGSFMSSARRNDESAEQVPPSPKGLMLANLRTPSSLASLTPGSRCIGSWTSENSETGEPRSAVPSRRSSLASESSSKRDLWTSGLSLLSPRSQVMSSSPARPATSLCMDEAELDPDSILRSLISQRQPRANQQSQTFTPWVEIAGQEYQNSPSAKTIDGKSPHSQGSHDSGYESGDATDEEDKPILSMDATRPCSIPMLDKARGPAMHDNGLTHVCGKRNASQITSNMEVMKDRAFKHPRVDSGGWRSCNRKEEDESERYVYIVPSESGGSACDEHGSLVFATYEVDC